MKRISIAIVADFQPASRSHAATSDALLHSAERLGVAVASRWIHTTELAELTSLRAFDGLWIGPGSPYANMSGVLEAIRVARENGIPLLGTCGGFQHLIIEYARNVLGFPHAEHEESSPQAAQLFIARLSCSLVGRTMSITLRPGSRLASFYGTTSAEEEYYCNFGVNPRFEQELQAGSLKISASDAEGLVRAVELAEHPFFLGTLFLPQHRSAPSNPHPVISAFVRACG